MNADMRVAAAILAILVAWLLALWLVIFPSLTHDSDTPPNGGITYSQH